MNDDGTPTLRLVLFPTPAFATGLASALTLLAEAGSLGQEILELPKAAKGVVGDTVGETVASLAGTRVRDILTGGWRIQREIRRAAEETATDPTDIKPVHLMRHRVTSTYRPEIDVYLDGVLLKTLRAELAASLTVSSLDATVQGGRLVSVDVGDVEAAVHIAVEGNELPGRTARLDLPGGIPLGDGIVIVEAPPP